MSTDRLPVTDIGVMVPRAWFGTATEVDLRAENGKVVLAPVIEDSARATAGPVPQDDPLWRLCDLAVDLDITDASTNLDKYLYDFDE